MNPESIEKTTWKIFWWVIGVAGTLGILIGIFWALFFSVQLANNDQIIYIRNWYQNIYWKVEAIFTKPSDSYPPFPPIFTVQPILSNKKPLYSYAIWGKYKNFDIDTKNLTVTAYDGLDYNISLDKNSISNPNDTIRIINTISGNNWDTLDFDIYSNTTGLSGYPVQIEWSDSRTLQQILSEHEKDFAQPINQNNEVFTIFCSRCPSK